ncbi:MAG: alpha/beta hydrolase [Oscillospiraceae bacterium]|nr:alpha/beta hydrolase [Oscillospiraceae bacterium]
MQRAYKKEYVLINGIKQFFLHYEVPDADVVLYLHGGPGSASSNFAYFTDKDISTHTMVYYDQRGAGKTLIKNKTLKAGATLPTMIEDLRQTIEYVKDLYNKDKVALIGHSWGSMLGTEYIKQYPNDILCYIGVGQVADYIAGEKVGYDKLLERIDRNNKKDMKKIYELGDYPFNTIENYSTKPVMTVRALQAKYGLAVNPKEFVKPFIKSPIFNLLDILALSLGLPVNKELDASVNEYDITSYKKYDVPMYYILGRDDWQVPSIVAADYFETIEAPVKRLWWIEDAGHFPSFDKPDEFNSAVYEALQDARGVISDDVTKS